MTFQPPPAESQPSAPPPPRQRKVRFVAIGVIAGWILGAGVMGLIWLLSSPGSDGPRADVLVACEAVERTPDLDPRGNFADLRRWAAATELAGAAAEVDPQYKKLEEALRAPRVIISQNFKADGPEFEAAMADARAACDDV